MDLKLNVQKRGLSTTAETINEEFTLHYGHIFKGEKGDKGEKGASIVVDTELSETSNNAIANSAVAKALGIMATKEELEVVQEETKENSKTLEYLIKSETKDISPTIAYEDSEVINGQVSAYKGYQVSTPIFLNKGEIISFTSYSGGGTQAISLTDANGSFYTSIDNTSGYNTRTYTAIEDCYVALSWLNIEGTYPILLTITRRAIIPPSGDAQHYLYESAGARWNADTGLWEFYDMKDITNIEMARAFARGSWYIGAEAIGVLTAPNEQSLSAVRFNIGRAGMWSVTVDMDYFASENRFIEFINLTFDNNLVSQPHTYVTYLQNSFEGCSNLRRIYGEMNVLNVTKLATPFTGCVKLEDVQLYGLKQDISFADSPLLSKASLLYAIENCASNASFTITLHPDVYEKALMGEWSTDVMEAIVDVAENKDASVNIGEA